MRAAHPRLSRRAGSVAIEGHSFPYAPARSVGPGRRSLAIQTNVAVLLPHQTLRGLDSLPASPAANGLPGRRSLLRRQSRPDSEPSSRCLAALLQSAFAVGSFPVPLSLDRSPFLAARDDRFFHSASAANSPTRQTRQVSCTRAIVASGSRATR